MRAVRLLWTSGTHLALQWLGVSESPMALRTKARQQVTKTLTSCLFASIVLLGTMVLSAEATQYRIRTLGAMAGNGYSRATGINSSGVVVGFSSTTYAPKGGKACYWDSTGVHSLGTSLSGANKIAINDQGDIAGGVYVWRGGVRYTLPQLLPSYGKNTFTDINSAGDVAGYSLFDYPATTNTHACLWDGDGLHDIGVAITGMANSTAYGINDLGQIVGCSDNNAPERGYVWQEGTACFLNPLQGYYASCAYEINNSSAIVGYSRKTGNEGWESYNHYQACVWRNGQVVDLGVSGQCTMARDINSSGVVVGYAFNYPTPFIYDAVVWENDVATTLPDLGGLYCVAQAINDSGWIVGEASDSNNLHYAVVWEPVPEPSSLLAVVCGLGGILWRQRRCRRRSA